MIQRQDVESTLFQRCAPAVQGLRSFMQHFHSFIFNSVDVSAVAAVKRLSVLHDSVVYISWPFVIIEPIGIFEMLYESHR